MSVTGLLNALNGLADLHEQLLALAREKQRAVIENRIDQLMTVTAKESKAISAMERLNDEVNGLAGECRKEMGLVQSPGATLADLLQAVYKPEWKIALADAAERLKTQVAQLKEINERNQLLVRHSLDYIQFQFDLIAGPVDDVTYASPTSTGVSSSRRIFDTRA